MYYKSTLSDLFADQVGRDNDDSYVSNGDWNYNNKAKHEEDIKTSTDDMDINDEELDDINDMGEEDDLLLNGNIANEENQGNHFCDYQHENQEHFWC